MSEEKTLIIDGSHGEGGGQILRTSLSLSSILKRSIQIENIRRGRKTPGLLPQHLTSVRAAGQVSEAILQGDRLGSTELLFQPGSLKSGRFSFNVAEERGSAGSVSLVLQTLFPPLSFSGVPSELEITGGTHVQWSPPFHFLSEVFLPALGRLGCHAEIQLERWGWYPQGGGRVKARIFPCQTISSLQVIEKGHLLRLSGISAVGNLPVGIAERQKTAAEKILKYLPIDCPTSIDIVQASGVGKGTVFFLAAEYENITAGFSSLGQRGKRAEDVAAEACRLFKEYFFSRGALDPYLSDQIILYLALSREESVFTTSKITHHLLTNIWCVKKFLPLEIRVTGEVGLAGEVVIKPL